MLWCDRMDLSERFYLLLPNTVSVSNKQQADTCRTELGSVQPAGMTKQTDRKNRGRICIWFQSALVLLHRGVAPSSQEPPTRTLVGGTGPFFSLMDRLKSTWPLLSPLQPDDLGESEFVHSVRWTGHFLHAASPLSGRINIWTKGD